MFDSLANLTEIEGKAGWWRLQSDLIYTVEIAGAEILRIVVPAGFVTNLASTPRWLWWIVPPFGVYNRATILHDYLYSVTRDRFFADAMLRVAMRDLQSPKWEQIAFFYATRLFGGRYQTEAKP